MFVLSNMVLKRYLACWTFRKCQPYSNESCLSICTHTYKIDKIEADNQLLNSTGNRKRSRSRRPKNGVPQGSGGPCLPHLHLWPATSTPLSHRDLSWHTSSTSTSIIFQPPSPESMHMLMTWQPLHADGGWQAVEGVLAKDMATVGEYLQTWKLKLSTTKKVLAAFHLNTLTSGLIQAVRKKTADSHMALRGNISAPVQVTNLVKASKDAASFVVCTRKKFFAWGVRVCCVWCHKCRTFRPPRSTLPDPGRQPLGGSISMKFLLDSRLQSESFDTLNDLLGFRVQKLWSKLVKIFD